MPVHIPRQAAARACRPGQPAPVEDWERLIARQQGMATRRQLQARSVLRRQLERLVADAVLEPSGRGLYRVPDRGSRVLHLVKAEGADPGFVADVRAELLTRGPDARAARRTAAVLWGMDMKVEPRRIELDVPRGAGTDGGEQCSVRSARSVPAVLWRAVPGTVPLRVTPAAETVLACAAELPLDEAVAIADSAIRRHRCTLEELHAALRARTGLGRAAHLRAVLRWCDPQCGSVLESLLRVLLALGGLPLPVTQHVLRDPVTGRERRVDFAWPAVRLVVEADGRRWHDPEDARDRDRRRDNTAAVLGWTVLRFSWREVVHEPQLVVASVRAALAAQAA